MGDHVVGHFSSNVGPRRRDWVGDRERVWPGLRPEQVVFVGGAARPASVVTVGHRYVARPDPADWRFREDGY